MSKIICIIIELEKRDDSMKEDLDTEKRAMEKAWAKRATNSKGR